jgi:hypothetical protein
MPSLDIHPDSESMSAAAANFVADRLDGPVSPQFPASYLLQDSNTRIICDRASAKAIS